VSKKSLYFTINTITFGGGKEIYYL